MGPSQGQNGSPGGGGDAAKAAKNKEFCPESLTLREVMRVIHGSQSRVHERRSARRLAGQVAYALKEATKCGRKAAMITNARRAQMLAALHEGLHKEAAQIRVADLQKRAADLRDEAALCKKAAEIAREKINLIARESVRPAPPRAAFNVNRWVAHKGYNKLLDVAVDSWASDPARQTCAAPSILQRTGYSAGQIRRNNASAANYLRGEDAGVVKHPGLPEFANTGKFVHVKDSHRSAPIHCAAKGPITRAEIDWAVKIRSMNAAQRKKALREHGTRNRYHFIVDMHGGEIDAKVAAKQRRAARQAKLREDREAKRPAPIVDEVVDFVSFAYSEDAKEAEWELRAQRYRAARKAWQDKHQARQEAATERFETRRAAWLAKRAADHQRRFEIGRARWLARQKQARDKWLADRDRALKKRSPNARTQRQNEAAIEQWLATKAGGCGRRADKYRAIHRRLDQMKAQQLPPPPIRAHFVIDKVVLEARPLLEVAVLSPSVTKLAKKDQQQEFAAGDKPAGKANPEPKEASATPKVAEPETCSVASIWQAPMLPMQVYADQIKVVEVNASDQVARKLKGDGFTICVAHCTDEQPEHYVMFDVLATKPISLQPVAIGDDITIQGQTHTINRWIHENVAGHISVAFDSEKIFMSGTPIFRNGLLAGVITKSATVSEAVRSYAVQWIEGSKRGLRADRWHATVRVADSDYTCEPRNGYVVGTQPRIVTQAVQDEQNETTEGLICEHGLYHAPEVEITSVDYRQPVDILLNDGTFARTHFQWAGYRLEDRVLHIHASVEATEGITEGSLVFQESRLVGAITLFNQFHPQQGLLVGQEIGQACVGTQPFCYTVTDATCCYADRCGTAAAMDNRRNAVHRQGSADIYRYHLYVMPTSIALLAYNAIGRELFRFSWINPVQRQQIAPAADCQCLGHKTIQVKTKEQLQSAIMPCAEKKAEAAQKLLSWRMPVRALADNPLFQRLLLWNNYKELGIDNRIHLIGELLPDGPDAQVNDQHITLITKLFYWYLLQQDVQDHVRVSIKSSALMQMTSEKAISEEWISFLFKTRTQMYARRCTFKEPFCVASVNPPVIVEGDGKMHVESPLRVAAAHTKKRVPSATLAVAADVLAELPLAPIDNVQHLFSLKNNEEVRLTRTDQKALVLSTYDGDIQYAEADVYTTNEQLPSGSAIFRKECGLQWMVSVVTNGKQAGHLWHYAVSTHQNTSILKPHDKWMLSSYDYEIVRDRKNRTVSLPTTATMDQTGIYVAQDMTLSTFFGFGSHVACSVKTDQNNRGGSLWSIQKRSDGSVRSAKRYVVLNQHTQTDYTYLQDDKKQDQPQISCDRTKIMRRAAAMKKHKQLAAKAQNNYEQAVKDAEQAKANLRRARAAEKALLGVPMTVVLAMFLILMQWFGLADARSATVNNDLTTEWRIKCGSGAWCNECEIPDVTRLIATCARGQSTTMDFDINGLPALAYTGWHQNAEGELVTVFGENDNVSSTPQCLTPANRLLLLRKQPDHLACVLPILVGWVENECMATSIHTLKVFADKVCTSECCFKATFDFDQLCCGAASLRNYTHEYQTHVCQCESLSASPLDQWDKAILWHLAIVLSVWYVSTYISRVSGLVIAVAAFLLTHYAHGQCAGGLTTEMSVIDIAGKQPVFEKTVSISVGDCLNAGLDLFRVEGLAVYHNYYLIGDYPDYVDEVKQVRDYCCPGGNVGTGQCCDYHLRQLRSECNDTCVMTEHCVRQYMSGTGCVGLEDPAIVAGACLCPSGPTNSVYKAGMGRVGYEVVLSRISEGINTTLVLRDGLDKDGQFTFIFVHFKANEVPEYILVDDVVVYEGLARFSVQSSCRMFQGQIVDRDCLKQKWVPRVNDLANEFRREQFATIRGMFQHQTRLSVDVKTSTDDVKLVRVNITTAVLTIQYRLNADTTNLCDRIDNVQAVKISKGFEVPEYQLYGTSAHKCLLQLVSSRCTIISRSKRVVQGPFRERVQVICPLFVDTSIIIALSDGILEVPIDGAVRNASFAWRVALERAEMFQGLLANATSSLSWSLPTFDLSSIFDGWIWHFKKLAIAGSLMLLGALFVVNGSLVVGIALITLAMATWALASDGSPLPNVWTWIDACICLVVFTVVRLWHKLVAISQWICGTTASHVTAYRSFKLLVVVMAIHHRMWTAMALYVALRVLLIAKRLWRSNLVFLHTEELRLDTVESAIRHYLEPENSAGFNKVGDGLAYRSGQNPFAGVGDREFHFTAPNNVDPDQMVAVLSQMQLTNPQRVYVMGVWVYAYEDGCAIGFTSAAHLFDLSTHTKPFWLNGDILEYAVACPTVINDYWTSGPYSVAVCYEGGANVAMRLTDNQLVKFIISRDQTTIQYQNLNGLSGFAFPSTDGAIYIQTAAEDACARTTRYCGVQRIAVTDYQATYNDMIKDDHNVSNEHCVMVRLEDPRWGLIASRALPIGGGLISGPQNRILGFSRTKNARCKVYGSQQVATVTFNNGVYSVDQGVRGLVYSENEAQRFIGTFSDNDMDQYPFFFTSRRTGIDCRYKAHGDIHYLRRNLQDALTHDTVVLVHGINKQFIHGRGTAKALADAYPNMMPAGQSCVGIGGFVYMVSNETRAPGKNWHWLHVVVKDQPSQPTPETFYSLMQVSNLQQQILDLCQQHDCDVHVAPFACGLGGRPSSEFITWVTSLRERLPIEHTINVYLGDENVSDAKWNAVPYFLARGKCLVSDPVPGIIVDPTSTSELSVAATWNTNEILSSGVDRSNQLDINVELNLEPTHTLDLSDANAMGMAYTLGVLSDHVQVVVKPTGSAVIMLPEHICLVANTSDPLRISWNADWEQWMCERQGGIEAKPEGCATRIKPPLDPACISHELSNAADLLIAECGNFSTMGKCSIRDKALATSYHVTEGNRVYYTLGDQVTGQLKTYQWKATHRNVTTDYIEYGNYPVQGAVTNGLYAVYNPMTQERLWMVCTAVNIRVSELKQSFTTFIPVDLDFRNKVVSVKKDWDLHRGWSGLPILDYDANTVGIYGLSIFAQHSNIPVYHSLVNPNVVARDVASTIRVVVDALLDMRSGENYKWIVLPTGYGKTTKIPTALAHRSPRATHIAVCEPTRDAAANAFIGMQAVASASNFDVEIHLVMGGDGQSQRKWPERGSSNKKIYIYTCGKALHELTRRGYDYIFIDEIHCRDNSDVLALDMLLQSGEYNSARKIAMTATPLTEVAPADILVDLSNVRPPFQIERLPLPVDGLENDVKIDLRRLGAASAACSSLQVHYIPRARINAGLTLIFAPTKNAVSQIAHQIRQQGIQPVYEYWSGHPLDVRTIGGTGVLVTTDALGVAVTINNVHNVVNIGLHNRPEVRLTKYDDNADIGYNNYRYEARMKIKPIGANTEKQRAGRTGRQNDGYVFSIPQLGSVEEEEWPDASVIAAVTTLAQHQKSLNFTRTCSAREAYEKYQWMLSSVDSWRRELGNIRVGGESSLFFLSYVSLEWLEQLRTAYDDGGKRHLRVTTNAQEQQQLAASINAIMHRQNRVVATSSAMYNNMVQAKQIVITPFLDTNPSADDIETMESAFRHITAPSRPRTNASVGQESAYFVLAGMVYAGVAVVGLDAANKQYGDRYLKKVVSISPVFLRSIVFNADAPKVEDSKVRRLKAMIRRIFKRAYNILKDRYREIRELFSSDRSQPTSTSTSSSAEPPPTQPGHESLDQLTWPMIVQWLEANIYPMIGSMTHMAASWAASSSILGMFYRQLCNFVGAEIAWVIVATTTAVTVALAGLKIAVGAAVIGLIAHWVVQMTTARQQYPVRKDGLHHLVASATGLIAGQVFSPNILQAITIIPGTENILVPVAATGLSLSLMTRGQNSSAVVMAYFVYSAIKSVMDNDANFDWNAIGWVTGAIATLPQMNLYSGILAVGIGGLAAFLTGLVKRTQFQRLTNASGSKVQAFYNYVLDSIEKDKTIEIIDSLFALAAVIADPTSTITIIGNAILEIFSARQGVSVARCFHKAFREWAGVNALAGASILLIRVGWKASHTNTESGGWFDDIWSSIKGLFTSNVMVDRYDRFAYQTMASQVMVENMKQKLQAQESLLQPWEHFNEYYECFRANDIWGMIHLLEDHRPCDAIVDRLLRQVFDQCLNNSQEVIDEVVGNGRSWQLLLDIHHVMADFIKPSGLWYYGKQISKCFTMIWDFAKRLLKLVWKYVKKMADGTVDFLKRFFRWAGGNIAAGAGESLSLPLIGSLVSAPDDDLFSFNQSERADDVQINMRLVHACVIAVRRQVNNPGRVRSFMRYAVHQLLNTENNYDNWGTDEAYFECGASGGAYLVKAEIDIHELLVPLASIEKELSTIVNVTRRGKWVVLEPKVDADYRLRVRQSWKSDGDGFEHTKMTLRLVIQRRHDGVWSTAIACTLYLASCSGTAYDDATQDGPMVAGMLVMNGRCCDLVANFIGNVLRAMLHPVRLAITPIDKRKPLRAVGSVVVDGDVLRHLRYIQNASMLEWMGSIASNAACYSSVSALLDRWLRSFNSAVNLSADINNSSLSALIRILSHETWTKTFRAAKSWLAISGQLLHSEVVQLDYLLNRAEEDPQSQLVPCEIGDIFPQYTGDKGDAWPFFRLDRERVYVITTPGDLRAGGPLLASGYIALNGIPKNEFANHTQRVVTDVIGGTYFVESNGEMHVDVKYGLCDCVFVRKSATIRYRCCDKHRYTTDSAERDSFLGTIGCTASNYCETLISTNAQFEKAAKLDHDLARKAIVQPTVNITSALTFAPLDQKITVNRECDSVIGDVMSVWNAFWDDHRQPPPDPVLEQQMLRNKKELLVTDALVPRLLDPIMVTKPATEHPAPEVKLSVSRAKLQVVEYPGQKLKEALSQVSDTITSVAAKPLNIVSSVTRGSCKYVAGLYMPTYHDRSHLDGSLVITGNAMPTAWETLKQPLTVDHMATSCIGTVRQTWAQPTTIKRKLTRLRKRLWDAAACKTAVDSKVVESVLDGLRLTLNQSQNRRLTELLEVTNKTLLDIAYVYVRTKRDDAPQLSHEAFGWLFDRFRTSPEAKLDAAMLVEKVENERDIPWSPGAIIKFIANLPDFLTSDIEIELQEKMLKKLEEDADRATEAGLVLEDDDITPIGRFRYLANFHYWNIGKPPRWEWWTAGKAADEPRMMPEVVEQQLRTIHTVSRRVNHEAGKMRSEVFKRLKYHQRLAPPSIPLQGQRASTDMKASKGAIKMQQLCELDPDFFGGAQVIWEPAAGSGGFGEYLSYHNRNRTGAQYFYSTLLRAHHRQPLPDLMKYQGSRCQQINVGREQRLDGDLRDPKLRALYREVAQDNPPDLIIVDCGETSGNTLEEGLFYWRGREYDGATVQTVDALDDLISNLKPGGRMIFKTVGVGSRIEGVVTRLTRHFRKIRVAQLPTTPLISREVYWYCANYDPGYVAPPSSYRQLFDMVICQLAENLTTWDLAYRHRSLTEKSIGVRRDWYESGRRVEACRVAYTGDDNVEPDGIDIDMSFPIGPDETRRHVISWRAHTMERLKRMTYEVRRKWNRRFVIHRARGFAWNHMKPIGIYQPNNQREEKPRHTVNRIIGAAVYEIWGTKLANGAYGCTQATKDRIHASYKERLDVDPGMMSPKYYTLFMGVLHNLLSTKGRRIRDGGEGQKFGILSEEETLKMINMKGATGRFSQNGNLKQFIENNPDWYEQGLARVHEWSRGYNTASYATVRPKKESKLRKDVDDDGRLRYEKGQVDESTLLENGDMTARCITFFDEVTRIAHIILLGSVVNSHHEGKLYRGSINGTPPHHVGKVLRCLWDMQALDKDRILPYGKCGETGTDMYGVDGDGNRLEETPYQRQEMAAMNLDFSRFDHSVTVEDRAAVYTVMKDLYQSEWHDALSNCLREMTFPICVDDLSNVWTRAGQRGSGEIWTSFENTYLALAHALTSIAMSMQMSVTEVTEMVGKVDYKLDDGTMKTYELMPIPLVADGDDLIIVTSRKTAGILVRSMPEYLALGQKIVRSGDKLGPEMVLKFNQLKFCSHTYTPTVVHPAIGHMRRAGLPVETLCRRAGWLNFAREIGGKLFWLPHREAGLVIGKLAPTLKSITAKELPDAVEEAKALTRAKCLSYLLLYPTSFATMITCLAILAYVKTGELAEMSKWSPAGLMLNIMGADTIQGALKSLYGITDFDSFVWFDYATEVRELKAVKHNASLIGIKLDIRRNDIINRTTSWLLSIGVDVGQSEYLKLATPIYDKMCQLAEGRPLGSDELDATIEDALD